MSIKFNELFQQTDLTSAFVNSIEVLECDDASVFSDIKKYIVGDYDENVSRVNVILTIKKLLNKVSNSLDVNSPAAACMESAQRALRDIFSYVVSRASSDTSVLAYLNKKEKWYKSTAQSYINTLFEIYETPANSIARSTSLVGGMKLLHRLSDYHDKSAPRAKLVVNRKIHNDAVEKYNHIAILNNSPLLCTAVVDGVAYACSSDGDITSTHFYNPHINSFEEDYLHHHSDVVGFVRPQEQLPYRTAPPPYMSEPLPPQLEMPRQNGMILKLMPFLRRFASNETMVVASALGSYPGMAKEFYNSFRQDVARISNKAQIADAAAAVVEMIDLGILGVTDARLFQPEEFSIQRDVKQLRVSLTRNRGKHHIVLSGKGVSTFNVDAISLGSIKLPAPLVDHSTALDDLNDSVLQQAINAIVTDRYEAGEDVCIFHLAVSKALRRLLLTSASCVGWIERNSNVLVIPCTICCKVFYINIKL